MFRRRKSYPILNDMKQEILTFLPGDHPWQKAIHWFDTIDSTNTRAKEMAADGAPHGTVLIAGMQTGGRGRLGRQFDSPAGQGVYLSVILRPQCPPQKLMHLTCAAAVAMCDAVQNTAGFRPRIKWTNDLVHGGKKLGGILTELSVSSQTGLVSYAVVGIGINCTQAAADFPAPLQDMAASLSMISGKAVSPAKLAGEMISALYKMDRNLDNKADMMACYRTDCMTVGQDIVLLRGQQRRYGTALDVTDEGGLVVRFADGTVETVDSGEISVRGMYGYI